MHSEQQYVVVIVGTQHSSIYYYCYCYYYCYVVLIWHQPFPRVLWIWREWYAQISNMQSGDAKYCAFWGLWSGDAYARGLLTGNLVKRNIQMTLVGILICRSCRSRIQIISSRIQINLSRDGNLSRWFGSWFTSIYTWMMVLVLVLVQ